MAIFVPVSEVREIEFIAVEMIAMISVLRVVDFRRDSLVGASNVVVESVARFGEGLPEVVLKRVSIELMMAVTP